MSGNGIMNHELIVGLESIEKTKASVTKTLGQVERFQQRIWKHIEDNYVDFLPNHTSSDMYIEEGELLLHDTEHLVKNVGSDARLALSEANDELKLNMDKLRETTLGLRISYRILKIDNLFQCIENAKSAKDFLVVMHLLENLKYLIFNESGSDVDHLFQKCDCYDTIKVKYHIQSNILQQNLQRIFERLVQFSEKSFPSAKNITINVSKDTKQLHDTVLALFQVT